MASPDGIERDHGAEKGSHAAADIDEIGADSRDYTAFKPGKEVDSNTGGLAGVEKIEATTKTWTKSWFIAAYVCIWVMHFVDSLSQQMSSAFLPYVTSSFGLHGLLAITGIVSGLVGGVTKLPLARIIDTVGRIQGLLLMLICVVISLVLMATGTNIETYAAAQTFFWTGMNGIDYILNIFVADSTTLRNRMILFGFTSTPYISNTFAGPALGQAFLDGSTWRWGYGAFAIITPAICAPIIAIFAIQLHKAKKLGLYEKPKSDRTILESVRYWVIELDVVGILLIVAGFSLFLLPFSLSSYQTEGWRSPTIISMFIIGGLCLIAFPFFEKFIAPRSFIPFELFKNRTVCYKLYFSSYLQVVFNLSVSQAGYIANIFNIVACAIAVPFGFAFRWSERYKWVGLMLVPLQILSTGLLIKFRMPGTHIGLIVFCEVIGSIAGGGLVMVQEIAIMASVPHRDVAVGLALLGMVTSCGGSIGQTISGAIWTNTLPRNLAEALPEELKANASAIYGSLPMQLSFEVGTPARDAIIHAYAETQKVMLIAATVALVGPIIWVSLMKNNRLGDREQTKGLVF
ncbi:MFS general substrate transporter [Whalleya microplaca]|nr:MFS general substrate transporter [Whalleya microplaca]